MNSLRRLLHIAVTLGLSLCGQLNASTVNATATAASATTSTSATANGNLPPPASPPQPPAAQRDSDGDGITDAAEAINGTNPNDRDSDHDGVDDPLDGWPLTPWLNRPPLPDVRYAVVKLEALGFPSQARDLEIDDHGNILADVSSNPAFIPPMGKSTFVYWKTDTSTLEKFYFYRMTEGPPYGSPIDLRGRRLGRLGHVIGREVPANGYRQAAIWTSGSGETPSLLAGPSTQYATEPLVVNKHGSVWGAAQKIESDTNALLFGGVSFPNVEWIGNQHLYWPYYSDPAVAGDYSAYLPILVNDEGILVVKKQSETVDFNPYITEHEPTVGLLEGTQYTQLGRAHYTNPTSITAITQSPAIVFGWDYTGSWGAMKENGTWNKHPFKAWDPAISQEVPITVESCNDRLEILCSGLIRNGRRLKTQDLTPASTGTLWLQDINNSSLIVASKIVLPALTFENFLLVPAALQVDADRNGIIDDKDLSQNTPTKPFRFWSNDDDDNPGATFQADYLNNVVDGADDLPDLFPVFLDIKQLLAVLPPSTLIRYKLKQADGALNLVYTNLTRATAFSYQSGTLTTGFGPSFIQPAATTTTQQITAAGLELSTAFLTSIKDQDKGVVLLEGRQISGEPLVLVVEKDGVQIAEVQIELCMLRGAKLWDTANKTNQIPNKTRKDDATAPERMEVEGDESYAVPRNNLHVVAAAADNKVKVSLDMEIPAKFRPKFYAAAWDGATKVAGSDAAFPATAGQPALLQIPAATTAETKEYQIRVGYDGNSNGILEAGEASPVPIYKRRDTHELRYAVVKGVSNTKYEEYRQTIEDKIGFLGQSQPSWPAKYARSFLALFYYNGDFDSIAVGVQPSSTGTQQLNAFANASGFSEWLTHNSGAAFTDTTGVAPINDYLWERTSEVAGFIAQRTPFALETAISNAQGYFESATATGTTLKAFYNAQVKAQAEQALQNSPIGATVTMPLDGGWYEFPRAESPNLFKSISPGNWVTPSTQIVGADDGAGGYGALIGDILAGTDEFNNFDAFGTIGRGRVLNPRYQITVKKEDTGVFSTNIEYKVSEVLFECAVEDLYDFNYEDTGRTDLAQRAATVQLGWGNGANGSSRNQGKVYRHRINIRQSYAYPFDQAMIVNP